MSAVLSIQRKDWEVALQEFFDTEIFGVAIRTVARVIVFGGITIILLRKFLRKIKGQNRSTRVD